MVPELLKIVEEVNNFPEFKTVLLQDFKIPESELSIEVNQYLAIDELIGDLNERQDRLTDKIVELKENQRIVKSVFGVGNHTFSALYRA